MENKKLRILNCYAGIGGNRKLWGESHSITAIEYKPEIAKIYQDFFPNDKVIVADAHQYLLEHFEEFDFIWSSPPCPTHSRIRKIATREKETGKIRQKPVYPDMKLYEEILFLQGYHQGKWCVENVIAWYDPLIPPQRFNSHWFWANFLIRPINGESREHYGSIKDLEARKGFELNNYMGIDKRKALRNCVEPETGKRILEYAINPIETQASLL